MQNEVERTITELQGESGRLVFSHGDLLSSNVIVLPRSGQEDVESVAFIDYEYSMPSPAAYDIANHFSEWTGYDCDYNQIPTSAVRRAFITEYVNSFIHHKGLQGVSVEEMVDRISSDVDRFRGLPGLYW